MSLPNSWTWKVKGLAPNPDDLEFDIWGSAGRRREPTSASCPLTSTCTSWCLCAHVSLKLVNKYKNVKIKTLLNSFLLVWALLDAWHCPWLALPALGLHLGNINSKCSFSSGRALDRTLSNDRWVTNGSSEDMSCLDPHQTVRPKILFEICVFSQLNNCYWMFPVFWTIFQSGLELLALPAHQLQCCNYRDGYHAHLTEHFL